MDQMEIAIVQANAPAKLSIKEISAMIAKMVTMKMDQNANVRILFRTHLRPCPM